MMRFLCKILILSLLPCAMRAATPGGVENCAYNGTFKDTSLFVADGMSLYCVQDIENQDERVFLKVDTKDGCVVLTDNRMADLSDLSYINFEKKEKREPQICSYLSKRIQTDSIRIRRGLTVDSIPIKDCGENVEMALFKRVLHPVEKRQVETYLAVKHDVTLKDSYVSSDRKTVWNMAELSDFSDCITGIALDEKSGLTKDTADNSVLRFKVKSEMQDGQYLMVGSTEDVARFKKDSANSCELAKKWVVMANNGDFKADVALNLSEFSQIIYANSFESMALEVDGKTYQSDRYGYFKNVEFKNGKNEMRLKSTDLSLADYDADGSLIADVSAYPNPTQAGNVRVKVVMTEETSLKVSLYDMNGKMLNITEKADDLYFDFTVTLPATGIYNLKLSTNGGFKTIQLIRQ